MSGNFGDDDHSGYSLPSEMNSQLNMNSMVLSRILKPEKGGGL
jgi:hypothetical protein